MSARLHDLAPDDAGPSGRQERLSRARRILRSLLAGVLAAAIPAFAHSVEIVSGQSYSGGTTLTASEVGVTTSVPTGWQAGLPAGGSALVMERPDQGAYIFVVSEEMSAEQALVDMAQQVDLGDGILFVPSGAPARSADGLLEGQYQVLGGGRTGEGAIYTRVGPSGIAVGYFAIDLDGGREARQEARRLAKATRFSKPSPPAGSHAEGAGGEGSAAWLDYMRGRYVARYYSGSNYHEKHELWLCSDGSFRRSGDAGGYGGAASGAFAGSGGGRWSATGKQPGPGELQLQFSDGVSRLALTLEGGKLYLDGTQWLRGENELCP